MGTQKVVMGTQKVVMGMKLQVDTDSYTINKNYP